MARAAVNQDPDIVLQGAAGFTGAHDFSIGKAYMANRINVVNNYYASLDTVPIDLVGHMVGSVAREQAIDFKAIWETALAQRSKGTCNWFLESLEFQRLVEERGTFLWGTGMPGSGKTILISVCIERLQETFKNRQDVAIAYVFFRYSEQISWPDVLAAIIKQLAWSCNGAHDVLLAIYSERRNPRPTTRSERDLITILHRIINNLNKVFIAIDGLDEAADETKVKLLEAFSSLDASILVTSRPLEPYASYAPKALWVPIQARTEDIGKLVEDRIQRSPRLKAILQGKPDLVKKLSDSIKEKSQGMFLLARLQMDALQSSNSVNSLFRKLSSLPSGISEMYQQTLERINAQPEEDVSIAHRVFLWLLHGFKTLSVEELQHALAVSFEDMSYDEGDVVSDSLLMSMCCGLVTTVTIDVQPFWGLQKREVRFIHYTAQEFMRSVAFPGFSSPHSLLSVACLGYLQAVNIESLLGQGVANLAYAAVAAHPFLRYAYDEWGRHAKESERHGSLHHHIASFLQRCNKFPLRVERPQKYVSQITVTRAWGLHLAARWGLVGAISSGDLPCPPTTNYDFSPFHLAIGSAFVFSASPDVPLMLEVIHALASSYGMSAGHIASRAFMGMTPFHLAVKYGSLECLQALISLAHSSEPSHVSNAEGTQRMDAINFTNSLQETPLVCALSGADATIEMILLLISQPNIDPTVRDSQGNTALLYACSNVPFRPPGSDHIAATLLSTFPHLISEACYSDGRGTNAFVEACLNNRNEAVTWLLNHDPTLVHQVHPNTGETALIRVCKQGHWPLSIPMVELLLIHGSDPIGVRDSVEGRSAFLWCLSPPRHYTRGKSLAPVIEALKKLVEHFPNPDLYKQRDKQGRTALMLAAMLEIPEAPIITFILSLPEIDVDYCNAHDNEGQTALTLACRNTREDIFQELIHSSLLLPSTIREGLVYAFANGFPGSAGAVLYELSMLPGLGVLNQGFEDYLSVILLAHAVKRACKRLILTLLMHVEGGAGARSPTNDRRNELSGICDCSECRAERNHEYYRSEPGHTH